MDDSRLKMAGIWAINEARPKGVGIADEPLEHSQPDKGADQMSHCGYICDSSQEFNPKHFAHGAAL